MKNKLQDDGIYCLSADRWQRIGGWMQVLARTRLTDKRHGHGALLEWQNFDGVRLREVVYARDLNSDNARQIRDMLVDTGYPLTPGQSSWSRLQHYLVEQMALAAPASSRTDGSCCSGNCGESHWLAWAHICHKQLDCGFC